MKRTLRILAIVCIVLNLLSGCMNLYVHQLSAGINNFIIAMLFGYIYFFDAVTVNSKQ